MKKTILLLALLFSFSSLFLSCGSSEEPNDDEIDQEVVDETELSSSEVDQPSGTANEDELRNFLYSTEGTYGWKSTQEEFFYDFMKDGRLHIQGSEGEATMWEGKWSLDGDQLTLENPDEDLEETVTIKIEGEHLIIGGVAYERYKP